ncbi:hypothetical protein [Jejuia pallidilutea]|uniref:hypothetical protein n=1 Tax=Jejuia pallidilutea TaxID=504487 RepID=UPI0011B01D94|nr:hypothetical protein [Jejuia pallidilutea]
MGVIEIEEFLESIVNPNSKVLDAILRAREIYQYKGKEQYNIIKTTELPCYTLNFCYNKYKKDSNIKEPSGYIYIDIDDNTKINLTNKLICASWRSLSNTGMGILVKVNELSLNNFKSTYMAISNALNIYSDTDAGKASQFNAQSYDPNLYYNENSIIWDTNTTNDGIGKNTPITYSYKIEKEKDVNELGVNLRYDNLGDIEFNNQPFLVFENEKLPYASFYIPSRIYKGSRNNIISLLAYQSYALNPLQTEERFRGFIYRINRSRCDIPLPDKEVEIIIQRTLNHKDIQPILNKERRIVFNPEIKLSKKAKHKVIGSVVGKIKSKNSIKKIEKGINDWDSKVDGKISQLRLAKKLNMSKNTINKYYHLFDEKTKSLKTAYKALSKSQ